MASERSARAREMLALMRANRDAPLREQGGGSQPAARTTISARESAGAIIDRHMARKHIQSVNRQPVAP